MAWILTPRIEQIKRRGTEGRIARPDNSVGLDGRALDGRFTGLRRELEYIQAMNSLQTSHAARLRIKWRGRYYRPKMKVNDEG